MRRLCVLLCLLIVVCAVFSQTPGSLSGLFSVSASTKVRFSQGNLQYQASTATWRFAEHQYDCIGANNKNISSTYSGWIDLFGWGTSSWNSGATAYQPYSKGTTSTDYVPGGREVNDLTDSYANADWGVYNKISNGGNTAGKWRTLTKTEWEYLLSHATKGSAQVNGVNGMILLPDNWALPSGLSFIAGMSGSSRYSNNVYTAEQWRSMELAGAVFLPAAGHRVGTSMKNTTEAGYWSSTHSSRYQQVACAYVFFFHESGAGMSYNTGYRYYGYNVRLVQNSTVSMSYTLTTKASPSNGGTVTSGGSIVYSKTKSLTATPKTGYQFSNWTVSGTGAKLSSTTATTSTFTMGSANATVTAVFTPINYQITVNSADESMGSASGGGSYAYNTSQEITATPNLEYQFEQWNDGNTDNPRTILVAGNATYTASFSYVGHNYGTPTYVWNADSTQCTATRICNNDASHVESETVTSNIATTNATCESTGLITYTAEFTNDAFASQTATKVLPALGHVVVVDEAVAPTCTETGLTEGSHCSRCHATLVAQNVVDALGHVVVTDEAVAPTCTETGLTEGSHCSRCHATLVAQNTIDALGHVVVTDEAVEPTCTETGLTEGSHCSRCHATLVAQNVVDALGHVVVTDEAVAPTCTETGLTEGSHCSRCHATLVAQNTVDALGHFVVTDEAVAPTCTETGLTEGNHCSRCHTTLVAQNVVDALGHDYGVSTYVWNADSTQCTATRICNNDASHVETETVTSNIATTNATCESTGLITYTAEFVNSAFSTQTATKILPALGHVVVVDEAVAPTCTETGLTEGSHCSRCHATLVAQNVVDTLGHVVVTDEAVAPTCTETGLTEGSHCSRCHATLVAQNVVDTLGHVVVTDEAVAPTCTETGLTEGSHCSRCHATLVAQNTVDALGHVVVTDEAVAPTCTGTGLTEGSHCSKCHATLVAQNVVDALGHVVITDEAVAPTCTETGLTEGSHCSRCHATLVAQNVVDALGHDYGAPTYVWNADSTQCTATRICGNDASHVESETVTSNIATINATCESTGLITYTAEFVNSAFASQIATKVLPALGHVVVVDEAVAPTCTETGLTEGSHCSRCHATLVAQNVVDALGHIVITDEAVAPTCTETGLTEGSHCSRCHAILVAQNVVDALGHDYGAPTYVWNADSTQCTATRICNNDASHVETETVNSNIATINATCEETGLVTYTAEFTNVAFAPQTATKVLPALGHDYGAPTYVWNSDSTQCTATRVCLHDAGEIETETVSKTSVIVSEPTCTNNGLRRHTVAFVNEGFTTQSYDEVIAQLEQTTHSITETSFGDFTLNGQTYTESGVYTQILPNSHGCDSVLTINLTVIKATDLDLTVSEQFTTCEYRDVITIESYSNGMTFTWELNGKIDNTQTGDFYRIPQTAPLSGTIKVTGTIGGVAVTKTIQYAIYKEIARQMWDDVVSIVNPQHEFISYEWYHNDKKISIEEYYNERGGVTGTYYVIATNKAGEKIHSCILDFGTQSQLKLFPNPTEGEVTIANEGATEIRIFDVKGKLLKVEQITPVENYSTIDLSRYPQGIYYLHIGKNVYKVVRK